MKLEFLQLEHRAHRMKEIAYVKEILQGGLQPDPA